MRKLFLSVCTALLSIVAVQAQNLGDRMVIEGVEGYVFYLDESGQHGLIMSAYLQDSKALNKVIEKGNKVAAKKGEDPTAWNEQFKSSNYYKACCSVLDIPKPKNIKKIWKKAFADLKGKTGADGKENAEIYAEYCKENGLSLAEVFTDIEWASRLGKGWFIPGDNELEKFAAFYQGGLGKEYAIGTIKWTKKAQEIIADPYLQGICFLSAFYGIRSSTINVDGTGARALRKKQKKGAFSKMQTWFQIYDKLVGNTPVICAVHEF